MNNTYTLNQNPLINPFVCGDIFVASTSDRIYGLSIYNLEKELWNIYTQTKVDKMAFKDNLIFLLGNEKDFTQVEDENGFHPYIKPTKPKADLSLVVLRSFDGRCLTQWDTLSQSVAKETKGSIIKEIKVEGHVLMIFDTDGNITAYDIEGRIPDAPCWKFKANELTPGAAVFGDDAVFYVEDNELKGVNVLSGQCRWKFGELLDGDFLETSYAPQAGNGCIIVSGQKAIYSIDWEDGSLIWTIKKEYEGEGKSTVSWEGDILADISDDCVYVYELSKGEKIWESDYKSLLKNNKYIEGKFMEPFINLDVVEEDIKSAKLVKNNHIFVPHSSGYIFTLDLTKDCTYQNGGKVEAKSISYNDNVIFVEGGLCKRPLSANGLVFACNMESVISSHSLLLEVEYSAYFEGNAYLEIPKREDFSFGIEDFSLELWIRSSTEGNLITMAPEGESSLGFSLRLISNEDEMLKEDYEGRGEIQFMTFYENGEAVTLSESVSSCILDGNWHHIAIIRKRNKYEIFKDGISLEVSTIISKGLINEEEAVYFKDSYVHLEDIYGHISVPNIGGGDISIGAKEENEGLRALMCGVRMWNRAVTLKELKDRMLKLLKGNENALVMCVPLNEDNSLKYMDISLDEEKYLVNTNVLPSESNLVLDTSLYPYLITDKKDNWPYNAGWISRGEDAAVMAPVKSGETLCFCSDNFVYAVDSVYGSRKWSLEIGGVGTLLSSEDSFYIYVDNKLMALDAESGLCKWELSLNEVGTVINGRVEVVLKGRDIIVWAEGFGFICVDSNDGSISKTLENKVEVTSSLIWSQDLIYYAAGHEIHKIALEDSKISSELFFGSDENFTMLKGDQNNIFAVAGNIIYKIAVDGKEESSWIRPVFSGDINGLALSYKKNRLLCTDKGGRLYFVDYSTGQIYNSLEDNKYPMIYPPVVEEDNVYCCRYDDNSKMGALYVYGIWNAKLHACEETAASVSEPFISDGTVYFGVDDYGRGMEGRINKGLHAIEMRRVYGLKFDEKLNLINFQDENNILYRKTAEGINCFNEGDFSFEAWINSESNEGQIFSIDKKEVEGTLYRGFSLSFDYEGKISATLIGEENEVFVSPKSYINDGKWHHLGVVFKVEELETESVQVLYFYLDGKALNGINIDKNQNAISAEGINIGGKGFKGFIQNIRLWETWLHAAEINTRKNVRLTGSEPDLLVDWNFSDEGINDYSLNDFSIKKELPLWLANVHYHVPDYPYLISSSKALSVEKKIVAGQKEQIAEAKYQVSIDVKDKFGNPYAGREVELWASQAVSISNQLKSGETWAITSEDIANEKSIKLKSDDKGKIALELDCINVEYSPTLWLRADFMYANERYHISPIHESVHEVIIPPKLKAQSIMLEDYKYTSGDSLGKDGSGEVDANKKINTVATIITIEDSNGTPMCGKDIEVFAESFAVVEVEGRTQIINPQNSYRGKTDERGSLQIVFPEKFIFFNNNLISLPNLNIRAGFLPNNGRFIVNPNEKIHKTMANLNSSQIVGEEKIYSDKELSNSDENAHSNLIYNYKNKLCGKINKQTDDAIADVRKNIDKVQSEMEKCEDEKKIEDYRDKIEEMNEKIKSMDDERNSQISDAMDKSSSAVRDALNHFMTIAGKNEPHSESNEINKNEVDEVGVLHHQALLDYHCPLTLEYAPNPHFVMTFGDVIEYHPFDSIKDLDAHLANISVNLSEVPEIAKEELLFGSWIKKAIHSIKHLVKDAFKSVKHVVTKTIKKIDSITKKFIHCIEVTVVDALDNAVKFVVKTVKEAVNVLVNILEKVWVFFKDIYEFLKELLDWKKIVDVHKVIHDIFSHSLKSVGNILEGDFKGKIQNVFVDLKKYLHLDSKNEEVEDESMKQSIYSMKNSSDDNTKHYNSKVNNSKSRFVMKKVKKSKKMSISSNGSILSGGIEDLFKSNPIFSKHSNLKDDLLKLEKDLIGIVKDGLTMNLSLKDFTKLFKDMLTLIVDLVEDIVCVVVDLLTQLIKSVFESLDREIKIPFISELYKLITGDKLSILDLFCLVLAIPVHLVFCFKGISFDKDDIMGIVEEYYHYGDKASSANNEANSSGNDAIRALDIIYVMSTILYSLSSSYSLTKEAEENGGYKGSGFGLQKLGGEIWGHIDTALSIIKDASSLVVGNYCGKDWKGWDGYLGMFFTLVGPFEAESRLEKATGIPASITKSFFGMLNVGWSSYGVDSSSGYEKAESVIGLLSAITDSLNFLCHKTVVDATGGYSVEAILIENTATYAVAIPTTHLSAGWGKYLF